MNVRLALPALNVLQSFARMESASSIQPFLVQNVLRNRSALLAILVTNVSRLYVQAFRRDAMMVPEGLC